jgi:hypothetical protein
MTATQIYKKVQLLHFNKVLSRRMKSCKDLFFKILGIVNINSQLCPIGERFP